MAHLSSKDPTASKKEFDNRAILSHFFQEGFNKRNLDVIEETYSPEITYHGPSIEMHGYKEVKEMMNSYFSAFHDSKITPNDIIAKGDKMVVRFTFEGVHKGYMEDIPPTGKAIKITGISICRMEKGKILEEWEEFDQLGLMKQLGMELRSPEVAH